MQKIDRDRKMLEPLLLQISELQQATKTLSLQNEVLSGAYETSERRVKKLESALKMLCDEVFDIYDSKHLDPKKSKGYKAGMKLIENCKQ